MNETIDEEFKTDGIIGIVSEMNEQKQESVDFFEISASEEASQRKQRSCLEKYECEHCNFIVYSKDEMAKHRRTIHGRKVSQYNNYANSFVADIKREQPVGKICEKCGKKFISRQSMKNHSASKCGTEKQFKCNMCGQCYMTKLSLAAHMVNHEGVKLFSCTFCAKKFGSAGERKVHERMHTKEKPFKCNICDKAFSYRESLVTHASVHTGIKPYLCMNCEKTFSCIGNLIKHRKAKPYTCGLPQFCQETKLIVPRTKTKTAGNANPKPEYDSYEIEILDADSETLESQMDADNLNEADIEILPENQKTSREASIAGLTEVENQTNEDCINALQFNADQDTAFISGKPSAEATEISPTDSIDYDEELEQYTVEFLDSAEETFEEDMMISYEGTQLPTYFTINRNPPLNAEEPGKTTKLEIKLDPDACFEIDMDYLETEQIYECSLCNIEFSSTDLLMEHLENAHSDGDKAIDAVATKSNGLLECPYCDEVFRIHSLYDKHLRNHDSKGSHRNATTVVTKTKDQILAAGSSSSYICPKCGKKCASRSVLRQHENSDCGASPQYQCKDCNQFYHSLSSLKMHTSVHTGDLPHLCSFCGKTFRTKGQFVVHMRKHTGEKPFQCHICSKAFPYRQSLVTHITTHTVEKPFLCDCGKSFSCVKNLLSHRNTFSGKCGKLPLNTKPQIQIGVIKGQLYIGRSNECMTKEE